MQLSDDQCLDQWIRQRDIHAFSELISRHGGMVYGVALRLTNDKQTALNIAKFCFQKLMKSDNLPPVPIAVFLHREATRESMAIIKSLPFPAEILSTVSWNDIKKRVDVLIANLSEKFSYPIILHILEGQEPANLVTHLRQPRERIEERIAKGIEHIRRGLNLVKINLTIAQLNQLLITNAYEPCPAQLNEAVLPLLQETLSPQLPNTKIQRKQKKKLIAIIASVVLATVTLSLLFLFIISLNRKEKTPTNPPLAINTPLDKEPSIPPPPEKEAKNNPLQSPLPANPNNTSKQNIPPSEDTKEISIDLNKKFFQLLYSRYDEQRKLKEISYYTSRDFSPTDAFFYYLLAVEALPNMDLSTLQPTWELLLAGPANPIPDDIMNTFANFQESFQTWRSGVTYERGIIPSSTILGESPFPIESFQNFFELFTMNILLNSRQPSENLISDINGLLQFAESIQKQVYGKLIHLPLFAIESTGIALREFARMHLFTPQQFREGMSLIERAEKITRDTYTVKYNEYRQIAIWAQTEFPTIPVLKQGLLNFLQEAKEKEWLDKISEAEIQSKWNEFLKLPDETNPSDTNTSPLEDLRKIIYPPSTEQEQHKKHVQTTLFMSRLFLAIEWYALDNASYPPSLEYLIPTYLSDIPSDKLSELSIQYSFDGTLYQIHTYEGMSAFIPWHGNFEY